MSLVPEAWQGEAGLINVVCVVSSTGGAVNSLRPAGGACLFHVGSRGELQTTHFLGHVS